jgi:hypothetical protein
MKETSLEDRLIEIIMKHRWCDPDNPDLLAKTRKALDALHLGEKMSLEEMYSYASQLVDPPMTRVEWKLLYHRAYADRIIPLTDSILTSGRQGYSLLDDPGQEWRKVQRDHAMDLAASHPQCPTALDPTVDEFHVTSNGIHLRVNGADLYFSIEPAIDTRR